MRRGVAAVLCAAIVVSLSVTALGSATSSRLAGSAGVVWDGTFAPGVFPWAALQARPGSFEVVPAPGGREGYAGRFLVRPGDSPIPSGERSEVFRPSTERHGSESIWAWSVYFPAEFRSNPNAAWNVFTQWHHQGSKGAQPVSFEIANTGGKESIRLRVWGGNAVDPWSRRSWSLGALQRDRWYDFVLKIRWAEDRSGLVQLWVNRRRMVSAAGFPTLYTGQGVYLKQGFYRGASSLTTALYIANTRELSSLDGLNLRTGPGRRILDA